MKRMLFILSALAAYITTSAQEAVTDLPFTAMPGSDNTVAERVAIGSGDAPTGIYTYENIADAALLEADSLHLPVLNSLGQTYINMYPYDGWGLFDWQLHSGLNLNVGASVFATFGNGGFKGAGFTQSLSAMYAVPITKKLSIAVGGYMNNIYWSRDAYRDAGFNAVIGYKFDEHWEGYVFGQKSLVDRRMPMPLYDLGNIGDRIGAAVKYNFNPKFSIQVSVATEKSPH